MTRTSAEGLRLALARGDRNRWVQTERAAHEAWFRLAVAAPRAAALMHVLVAQMGKGNLVRASQRDLMNTMNCSRATLQKALYVLRDLNWVDIRVVEPGGPRVYVINSDIVWVGDRARLPESYFWGGLGRLEGNDANSRRTAVRKKLPMAREPQSLEGCEKGNASRGPAASLRAAD